MIWPVNKNTPITGNYGATGGPWGNTPHRGTDFGVQAGTPVVSALGGVVAFAGWDTRGGNCVRINTGNISLLYAHLSVIEVRAGQSVAEGARIGLSGATGYVTGPHLHFEATQNGAFINSLDLLNNPGKYGVGAPKPTPAPGGGNKSNDTIANEVIRGDWGNGADRVNRLRAAGYDPGAIQAIVNGRVTPAPVPSRKSNDEIATEVIRGGWDNGSTRVYRLRAAGYDPGAIQAIVNRRLG